MTSPASLVTVGLLGIALLGGDSVPTLGIAKPVIFREQAPCSQPQQLGAFSLQPITGLEAAQQQVSWCKQHIPASGNDRALRLSSLTRLYFFLGEAGGHQSRHQNYQLGRNYARLLIKEQPQRVEGYYWLALNLCGLASVSGAKDALNLLPRIIDLLETSLGLDEAYDQAGAHRVLGRIYYQAPAWPLSVGDQGKSLLHLSSAVKLAPQNSTNQLFLAEVLYSTGKAKEANRALEKVLNGTRHALWPKGLAEDQQKAQQLIRELNARREFVS